MSNKAFLIAPILTTCKPAIQKVARFIAKNKNDCSVTHSLDVVCGRFIYSFLVRLDFQLESCQESRRTPFDISPLTPAEEKTQFMAFLKVY